MSACPFSEILIQHNNIMNVSSVSQSQSTFDPSAMKAQFKQRRQDFQSLQDALQSGDLSAAQSAFAALQKDAPAGKADKSKDNSPMSKDFQALQTALQSGNISDAQKAFATLQQDMKTARAAHHHHHHQASDSTQTPAATDLTTTTPAASASTTSSGSLNVQA